MKIVAVEPVLLTVPFPPEAPIRWSGGVIYSAHIALVRVRTADGLTGLGEVYSGLWVPEVFRELVHHFTPQLIGQDARNISGLWQKLYSGSLFWGRTGISLATIGAIETALWDLAGKATNLPVYQLMGGAAHDRLRLYASGGLERPLDELVSEMKGYYDAGYTAIKVRVGLGPAQDRKKVQAVREAIGFGTELLVDAAQGHNPEPWTSSEAIAAAEAIKDFDISWFEEPCAATDWNGYAHFRSATCIPVAGGESSTGVYEFSRFLEAKALDIIQPDVAHCGGVREWLRIAALAQAQGVRVVPHVWGAGVGMLANYHLALATPGCNLVEHPTWGLPLRDELLVAPLDIRQGHLYLSDSPGLGVELRPEVEKEFAYKEGLGLEMRHMQVTKREDSR